MGSLGRRGEAMQSRQDGTISSAYVRKSFDAFTQQAAVEAAPYVYAVGQRAALSSQQAEEVLAQNRFWLLRLLIQWAFRYRRTLKRLPVVGKLLVRRKERMLQSRMRQDGALDLSDCLGWYADDFIRECYRRMLGREPDPEGYAACQMLFRQGAGSGVIVYMVASSAEFAGRAEVRDLPRYRKEFRAFRGKQRLLRIPVLGRVAAVLWLPEELMRLYQRVERSEAVAAASSNQLHACLDQSLLGIAGSCAALERSVALLSTQLRDTAGEVAAVSRRLDAAAEQLDAQDERAEEMLRQLSGEMRQVQEQAAAAAERGEHLWSFCSAELPALHELAALGAEVSHKLDSQMDASARISSRLDSQLEMSAGLSEKLDSQLGISTGISRKLDEQEEISTSMLQKLDGQMGISTNLSEKLDGQTGISTSLSEKLDQQIGISTSLSQKLDGIPGFVAQNGVLSHTAVTGIAGGVTGILADGFILGVPSEEWGLAMYLSQTGHFEAGSEQFFEACLRPGMTVLDLGANLGMYTLRALRKGCRVFSYEPTPRTCRLLQQNIKVNGFLESGRSHVVAAAVSDTCGNVEFFEIPGMCGHNSIYEEDRETRSITVPTVTLDSQIEEIGRVDVIKMDIEGAEYRALLGMRRLLERNPQVQILMEFAPGHIKRAGVSPEEMLDLIHELGFTYALIDEESAQAAPVGRQELLAADSVNLYLKREGGYENSGCRKHSR